MNLELTSLMPLAGPPAENPLAVKPLNNQLYIFHLFGFGCVPDGNGDTRFRVLASYKICVPKVNKLGQNDHKADYIKNRKAKN